MSVNSLRCGLVSLGLKTPESFQGKKGCKSEAELLLLTDNHFGRSEYKIEVAAYSFVHKYGNSR